MQTYTVLSLGAGVQSSVVLLLSCHGILPKLNAAIFADTQWESKETYKHLDWLEAQAAAAGIPLLRRSVGNIREDMLRGFVTRAGYRANNGREVSMPLFTKVDGKDDAGMIRRQCTREYKLDVIRRAVREDVLCLTRGQRVPPDVEVRQWIGISIDEKRRMRQSDVRWITNEYPLIGWPTQFLSTPKTRAWCKAWFAEHYPGRTLPRSACIGCPMHSNQEWRDMRDTRPDEWADAVAFDAAIRTCGGLRGDTFLHRSCLPLDQADLSNAHTPQDSLFVDECLGMCGV